MKKTRFPNKLNTLNTQRVLSKNSKRFTVTLVGVFLMIFALVTSMVGAKTVFGLVESSTPNAINPDSSSEYRWYGYESYVRGHPYYKQFRVAHDLRVNLEGSRSYQVYCFNLKKAFPLGSDSSVKKWYKKHDGISTKFEDYAISPRITGDELNQKLRAVMYNGHPQNANGIMEGLEPLNAIRVTQEAVWYYSDNAPISNPDERFKRESESNLVSTSQLSLMRQALKQLIDPNLATKMPKQVPDDFQLSIFESEDKGDKYNKGYQNLLSGGLVPTKPPTPGDPPMPPNQPQTTSVLIRKYAIGDYSKLLEGATLQLTGDNVNSFQARVFSSNDIGERIELSDGTYTLTELNSPAGYSIAEPITFKVEAGKVYTIIDGKQIENPNKEIVEPYSVEAYNDFEEFSVLTTQNYAKFYYAKNKNGSSQVVYCFNADLKSPPDSEDGGKTMTPDFTTGEVKYTHIAGRDLFKYTVKPRDTDPDTFLKHIKKVIEKGYREKGQAIEYSGLTETQLRAATQLAIYYFTDSAELDKDKLKDYHGFGDMNDSTLAVAKILVEYAQDSNPPQLTDLDFFIPNNNKYQSLIGTQWHPEDLVDIIRMEDKKEVIPVTHNLTLRKTVTGLAGDRTKDFHFEIELKNNKQELLSQTVKTDKTNLEFKDGKATINLKHGESLTLQGLPEGYSYLVKETDSEGYKVKVNSQEVANATVSKTGITSDETLAFENNKEPVVPTGVDQKINGYLALIVIAGISLGIWGIHTIRIRKHD
ncbi:TPA: FCT-2 pilus tip adhesin [Streptococcus pyogenes]|nr:FCT-2 pilus tip adhesin [Streptococcus pyogenes]